MVLCQKNESIVCLFAPLCVHFVFMCFCVCACLQHLGASGAYPGEVGPPAEGDLRGLRSLPLSHPAGQPRAGAPHRGHK